MNQKSVNRNLQLDKMTQEINKRINAMQNNDENNKTYQCEYDNLVVFDSKTTCGYGCQVHGLAHASLVAYNQGRTLIITSTDFPGNKSYEAYFEPISEQCNEFKPSFQKQSENIF